MILTRRSMFSDDIVRILDIIVFVCTTYHALYLYMQSFIALWRFLSLSLSLFRLSSTFNLSASSFFHFPWYSRFLLSFAFNRSLLLASRFLTLSWSMNHLSNWIIDCQARASSFSPLPDCDMYFFHNFFFKIFLFILSHSLLVMIMIMIIIIRKKMMFVKHVCHNMCNAATSWLKWFNQ